MGIKEVLVNLNKLKETGIIIDYAIGGGYGVMFHGVSLSTYDLDVFVILATENDFHKLYEYYRIQGAIIEGVYIYIEGMPVQFLPNISLLSNRAIEEAIIVEFEGVTSRFINIEYLVLLLLTSYREKDKIRLKELIRKGNKNIILSLIGKFDSDDKLLHKRYQEILART